MDLTENIIRSAHADAKTIAASIEQIDKDIQGTDASGSFDFGGVSDGASD